MDFYDDSTDPGSDSSEVVVDTEGVHFDVAFQAVASPLTCILLVLWASYGVLAHKRGNAQRMRGWPLYYLLLAYLLLAAIEESISLGYSVDVAHDRATDATYLTYIFFWHASSASFLLLLLAVASGYCITRKDLGHHKHAVIGIPLVVLTAGLVSDYVFWYVVSTQTLSTAGDRYSVVHMTTGEETAWAVGSVANLFSIIMAWVYVYDSTKLELAALDEAQNQQRQKRERAQQAAEAEQLEDGPGSDSDSDSSSERGSGRRRRQGRRPKSGAGGAAGSPRRALATTSQRATLLGGAHRMSDSPGARLAAGGDVEAGGDAGEQQRLRGEEGSSGEGEEGETVADRLDYVVRKKLLSRFWYGVCAYLAASMGVILLPAFFNETVQNSVIIGQFAVKYIFTLLLMWTFRPLEHSPYLMVGASDVDADDLGVSQLDTELAVTEFTHQPGAPGDSALAEGWGKEARAKQQQQHPSTFVVGDGGMGVVLGAAAQHQHHHTASSASHSHQQQLPVSTMHLPSQQQSDSGAAGGGGWAAGLTSASAAGRAGGRGEYVSLAAGEGAQQRMAGVLGASKDTHGSQPKFTLSDDD